MTYYGSIATLPTSRRITETWTDLLSPKGAIYSVNTPCRETLCGNLADANFLINQCYQHNGYIKIGLEDRPVSRAILPPINNWLSTTRGKDTFPLYWNKGQIVFRYQMYSSEPLISIVALLMLLFDRPFTMEGAMLEILLNWDDVFDDFETAYFTAMGIWRGKKHYQSHQYYKGLNSSGIASFVKDNLFWEIDYHIDFYRYCVDELDIDIDSSDFEDTNDYYWDLIERNLGD